MRVPALPSWLRIETVFMLAIENRLPAVLLTLGQVLATVQRGAGA
jgi:hypothetical protein